MILKKIKNVVINYVCNNFKEFILNALLFVIGIFVGVIVVNNLNETQTNEIVSYIFNFVEKFRNMENIDKTTLIVSSIKNNVVLAIVIWIAGTTVIGVPIVLLAILFRGICLGYTISSITCALGTTKGILFCFFSLFAQNILFIPALLGLGVSSIKLYKSIIKDRRKENIKIEIIRHTIFSLMMTFILILSSFIENTISIFLLQNMIIHF